MSKTKWYAKPIYVVVALALVLSLTGLVMLPGQAEAQLADTPWPMFHHDVQHTGQSPYLGAQTSDVKWSYNTDWPVDSSPAIASDGTIYVGSYLSLYAINPDGSLKWFFPTGNFIHSSPAISSDGTIYIGSDDHNLYAINSNGTLKWSYATDSRVWSSPAIASDGTIYVGSQLSLYAINPDGTLKWSYTVRCGYSSPAIGSDGTIYVGSDDYNLYAINPNGTLKWFYATGDWVDSSPAIGSDGTIYAKSLDYNLYAINPDGTLKWSYTGRYESSSPAIGIDGTIYVGLDAINPDGTLKWSFLPEYGGTRSSPAIGSDGVIYVGLWDSNLYAINPDGTEKWSYATGGSVESSPAIGIDGTIYVGSDDNKLYAFGTPEGVPGQPDITVSPTSLEETLPPDTSQGYTLTIGNAGDATLTYTITDRTTTGGGSYAGTETVPELEWSKTFGDTMYDCGNSVQQTSDGGYIIAGSMESFGQYGSDVWLIKTDANGDKEWDKTFDGNEYVDDGYSVQQTSDGGYIIAGDTWHIGGVIDGWLIKTDANGDKEWDKTFGGPGEHWGWLYSVQQTLDGGYIAAGAIAPDPSNSWDHDVWLIKTDPNGDEIWSETFGNMYLTSPSGYSVDRGNSVQQTSDGGYIITGQTDFYGSWVDVWLIKTDSNGVREWDKTFGGVGWDWGNSVQQTSDGGFIVAGYTEPSAVWLIKTDANGDGVWSKTFSDKSGGSGESVQQTSDGGYIITGYMESNEAEWTDVWLIKTDSNGNKIWDKTFEGKDRDWGESVQQTSDGGYIIAGVTGAWGYSPSEGDVWLLKLNPELVAGCLWLDEEPKSGVVGAGGSNEVTITVDTTGLEEGDYSAEIVIANNDPDENPTIVPVTLHVSSDNNPPNTPSNPSPADDATGVSINADLSWTGGDPDVGDTVTYDVYFGTSVSPPLVSNDQAGTTYDPGTLSYNTKYYWKIVATDNHAASTTGSVWDFTTGSAGGPQANRTLPDSVVENEQFEVGIDISGAQFGQVIETLPENFDFVTTDTVDVQCEVVSGMSEGGVQGEIIGDREAKFTFFASSAVASSFKYFVTAPGSPVEGAAFTGVLRLGPEEEYAVGGDTTVDVGTEGWDPWDYDENTSGYIEIGELLHAISDYIGGNITISQLLEIISLYISHTERPPVEDYILQESQTIGPEGGELTIDDFSLMVPSASFDSDVELKLYASSGDRPFGDNDASRAFRLEGLPDEYHQPLQVQIKYQGMLSEESFIAVGEEVFISSLGSEETSYHLFAAIDSSGYLSCELPVLEGTTISGKNFNAPTKASSSGGLLGLLGITSYSTYTSGEGHFQIEYPVGKVSTSDVAALAGYLEEAYTKFQNMGFSYAARTAWPVEVSVMDLGTETYGLYCPSIWGDNSATLRFNQRLLHNLSEIRTTAGHEFFHLVQYLYDPRNCFSKAKFEPIQQWLNEACAVWSEALFSNNPNYVSSIRAGHVMAPFNGMQAGAQSNAGYHGYGMSAFTKYLVDEYGQGILVSIYQNIKDDYHPVQAISASTSYQLPIQWEPFLREYVTGNIYNVQRATFTGNISDLFRIQSDSDVSKTFTASYPDLSAKLFMVRLDYPEIDENADIRFTVDESLSDITVFKFKFDPAFGIEYLAHSTDSVCISNLRALTDGEWHLLAMVTNLNFSDIPQPYTNSRDITLEISPCPCTDEEIWSVFPTAEELGVNAELLALQEVTTRENYKEYLKCWAGNGVTREVDIWLRIYRTMEEAREDVEEQCAGWQPVSIGDGGYWNGSDTFCRYRIYRNNVEIILWSLHGGQYVGPQDAYLQIMVDRLDNLPCEISMD